MRTREYARLACRWSRQALIVSDTLGKGLSRSRSETPSADDVGACYGTRGRQIEPRSKRSTDNVVIRPRFTSRDLAKS